MTSATKNALRVRHFVRVLELNNPHEIERDDLAGIPSIGTSTGAGMTEESKRRIKAGTRLLFSASWKDAKGEEEEGSLRWSLPPRECLDPEPSTAESLRDEEEKKSAKEPMPRSVIRVALPCPLTFRGVRTEVERESVAIGGKQRKIQ